MTSVKSDLEGKILRFINEGRKKSVQISTSAVHHLKVQEMRYIEETLTSGNYALHGSRPISPKKGSPNFEWKVAMRNYLGLPKTFSVSRLYDTFLEALADHYEANQGKTPEKHEA